MHNVAILRNRYTEISRSLGTKVPRKTFIPERCQKEVNRDEKAQTQPTGRLLLIRQLKICDMQKGKDTT
jgi:hypothetical protein